MEKFIKILTRVIDYFWFWSISIFILDLCDLSLVYSVILTLSLTLLFIPVEALFLRYFSTTLGKYISGYKYNEIFTWKSAYTLAWRKALFLRIKTEEIRIKPRLIAHILAFGVVLIGISPEKSVNQACKALPFEWAQSFVMKRNGGGNCPDGWVKLITAEPLPFTAFFPTVPVLEEISKPIPHSERVLLYKEYKIDQYSLGFVDLPQNWVKWGSNIVFKAAISQITSKEKGNVTHKTKTTHDEFPAMDYKIDREGKTAIGRLILVGTTVYNLEVKLEENSKEQAILFFNAFQLQK